MNLESSRTLVLAVGIVEEAQVIVRSSLRAQALKRSLCLSCRAQI
jgi:hypothetical protein